jgi:hypothetical protein
MTSVGPKTNLERGAPFVYSADSLIPSKSNSGRTRCIASEVCLRKVKKRRASAAGPQDLSHCLCCQTIQAGGIAYDHLSNLPLRNSGEVLGNLLSRVRKGALGMRIV